MNNFSHKCQSAEQCENSENCFRVLCNIDKACDVELVAAGDSKRIFCHRSVLESKSDYFFNMFSSGMRESEQGTITLRQVHGNDLKTIIKYCYTEVLDIDEEIVAGVLSAANMLQFEAVEAECVRFIEQRLSALNCLEVETLAELLNYKDLQNKAEYFARAHFMKVCHTEQFLNLTIDDLIQLIEKDDLFVETEVNIFNAVCTWVQFNPRERIPLFTDLLSVVRQSNLPASFFEELELLSMVHYGYNHPLVQEAFRVYCSNEKPPQAEKPRKWINSNMLALTSLYSERALHVDHFCVETKTWSKFGLIPVKRESFGAAILDGKLYVIGGFHDEPEISDELTTVESFDLNTRVTITLSPMLTPRKNLGVVVLGGLVYAIGGCIGYRTLSSAERYDPSSQSWSAISSMSTARYGAGYAVFMGRIYAVGGIDSNGVYQNSMECYDPATDRWTSCASMKQPRAHLNLIADHNFLYVVGGYGLNGVVKSGVDLYDPYTDNWEPISPLKETDTLSSAFVGLELMVFQNRPIYMNESEWEMVIQTYSNETDTWSKTIVASSLGCKSVHCVVPIKNNF